MQASIKYRPLYFNRPAGTSRGVLTHKECWYLILKQDEKIGIGEVSLLQHLSLDDKPDFKTSLNQLVSDINNGLEEQEILAKYKNYPSIIFAFETALLSLKSNNQILFPSPFTEGKLGIQTNGLIWMGDQEYMQKQIEEKLLNGFKVIKLKIGHDNFANELNLIKSLRQHYTIEKLEIRVDANGAFNINNIWSILEKLSKLDIHSIEQPIATGHYKEMLQICKNSPIPIALDEELIGLTDFVKKYQLITLVKPQIVILKPGLLGGFESCNEWIKLLNSHKIAYWITSSLESNIGLSAIAQWCSTLNLNKPQGLGTGSLFNNNIPSPLIMTNEKLFYNPKQEWDFSEIHA